MIILERGGWRLSLRPDLGGSIARLTVDGRDVLRPTADGETDILQVACFPLVPYANRIADGRFSFDGRAVTLPALPQFTPHALHGDGWLSAWKVEAQGATSARMAYRHDAGDWPWAYEAIQTFALTDAGLRVDLSVRNLSDAPMPAGLGLHPYFPVGPDTRLTLTATSVWRAEGSLIPTAQVGTADVLDWSQGRSVADAPFVDHCYAGWDGSARIEVEGRATTVRASSNAGWAHVYAPGEDFCCVEPVTHRPNALHAPAGEASGLAVLQSGEGMAMWMEIGVT